MLEHTPEELSRITLLLTILKKTSLIYRKANNTQKSQIFDKYMPYVDQLVSLGYYRDFTESLLMFGDEFLASPSIKDAHPPYYQTLFPEAFEVFL
jgi:hypothetical protein